MGLAGLCAVIFAVALQSAYPDGKLTYVADSGAAPRIMDAFYTGLALGTFFCCLIYAAMAMSAFLLNRLRSTPLRPLPLPLSAAFASCLLLTVLIYVLASHGA